MYVLLAIPAALTFAAMFVVGVAPIFNFGPRALAEIQKPLHPAHESDVQLPVAA